MLSLPIERTVMGRERFQDQVVRLPETFRQSSGVAIRGGDFEDGTLHETHFDAPARNHVEHRVFLRDPDRIHPIGDRHAKAKQTNLLRLTRQDC